MKDASVVEAFVVVLLAVMIYFFPAVVAVLRRHRSALAIFVLTLLLGWTLLGWVLALVWAFTPPRETRL